MPRDDPVTDDIRPWLPDSASARDVIAAATFALTTVGRGLSRTHLDSIADVDLDALSRAVDELAAWIHAVKAEKNSAWRDTD